MGAAGRRNQVDMYTCTHSKQGVGSGSGVIETKPQSHTGDPGFHQTMHMGWSRHGQSDGHKFMY